MNAGEIGLLVISGTVALNVAGVVALVTLAVIERLGGQRLTDFTLVRLLVLGACFVLVYSEVRAIALAAECERYGTNCR